jgi:hypothetical protein
MPYAGTIPTSLLDLRKYEQAVHFILDIVDTTTEVYTGVSSLVNASSSSGFQRISGRIESEREVATMAGAVLYGQYVNGTNSTNTATLENLTIVTGTAPCIIYAGGGFTDIPCKAVYANNATSAANGGVAVIVDASITVSTDVI